MNMIFKSLLAGTALVMAAAPSFADVKAGVDAWDRGDFANAVKEWRPLAVKGDADAQFNLAQAYRFGRGVPSDMKQAEEWYRRAATQGHVQAEDNLGLIMFQNGDTSNAMPIIERSANRGEPRAQFVYGTALFNGDMVRQDWPRAYGYMTRASAAGLSRASSALAQMDQYIPLEQRQQGLTVARQLETQAARSKFAAVQPKAPQGAAPSMAAPVLSAPSRPKIASNTPVYIPQPMPQSMPQPMPQINSTGASDDPYLDSPEPTGADAPVVIQSRKSAKASTSSRAAGQPNWRGALPSPRSSSRVPTQPKVEQPEQTDNAGTNPGDWNGPDAKPTYPGQPYPQQTYPQDPAGGYPTQSYPNQSYPQDNYPPVPYPQTSYPEAPVKTMPVRKAIPAPRAVPVAQPRPVQTAQSATGSWRIQLGAFSTTSRADMLWKSMRGRVGALSGKQPYMVKAGTITRLQAGGFPSRSAAESACAQVRAAGSNCLVVSR
jgi:uncharacterized protein